MKRISLWLALACWGLGLVSPSLTAAQSDDEAIVRAVLFYSPSCPHCHYVIGEVLSPLAETHGERLQIIGLDTTQPEGARLYEAAIERYEIPSARRGVPTLVVAETVLVGSQEIPEQFPALIDQGLVNGGIDWPDIPGLAALLAQAESSSPAATASAQLTATPAPATPAATATSATPTPEPVAAALEPTATAQEAVIVVGQSDPPPITAELPTPDPAGFTLAGLVLAGLVGALAYSGWRLASLGWYAWLGRTSVPPSNVLVPLLAVLGLGVAAYLAYVEVNQVTAVCGPVGDCNRVQASPYAQLLGVPVAGWGILSYVIIIGLWIGQRVAGAERANFMVLALVGLTLLGTIFSIYLTVLELVVIRAVCLWCLSSAAITAALLVLVVAPLGHSRGLSWSKETAH
ncbi:MAG TPA: vitamin K epoxide reductase family protein [Anaerolineae bacterium]|nr:vitamin K epoxide reductase family protein [Anaerolineae bacterium]HMR64572.1 vitamin K epoxide reductase family protein [Anaerolineae bacterium]